MSYGYAGRLLMAIPKQLFNENAQLLRAIVDAAEGEGSAEAVSVLRSWRTLSRADQRVAWAQYI